MIKLLLIEDDPNLSYIIKNSFEEIIGGYEVTIAADGEEGLTLWKTVRPDIIVSDIEMPVLKGLDVIKKIRKSDAEIPFVFATAKTASKDVIAGYEAGANNYIKKPFIPEELDAHIKALVNLKFDAKVQMKNALLKIGKYLLDLKKFYLIYNTERIKITNREFQILKLLAEKKGEVVKRQDILLKFWGLEDTFTSRSLDVFITKLRRSLSKDPSIKITNIKRIGLILDFE